MKLNSCSASKVLIERYERYRASTLNLIASENILSRDVLRALGSSMAGRYAGRPESYGGSRYFHQLWEQCESLAIQVFNAKAASVAPISGHIAAMMALDSLAKPGDKVAVIPEAFGGYKGYNEGFMPEVMGLKALHLPYDFQNLNVDLPASLRVIENAKPRVVVLGATVFLFPHPVKEIGEAVHRYGGSLIFDGSHVLGLVAGGEFQKPLEEGADLLLGSTHKTLFGPQGGIILSKNTSLISKIEEKFLYRFADNFHLNRVAALAVALEEMKKHRKVYASNVIRNSKVLAEALYFHGLPVAARGRGFTKSHQILLRYGETGEAIRDTLESNSIICDSRIRLGTSEVTRRGMSEREMKLIAELVADSVVRENDRAIRNAVKKLVMRHSAVKYTLEN